MSIPLRRLVVLSLLLAPASAQGVAREWDLGAGGKSVASAGDVDGDGFADFALALKGSGSTFGRVEVYAGPDGGLLWTALGATAGDRFGESLVGLGDVDGDGSDDLAVSATQIWAFGSGPPTYVRALSGADGSTLWQVDADELLERFGDSLARIADLDGDGADDLIVGSTLISPGEVRVLSGSSGATLLVAQVPAGARGNFGTCVAALGDLDGDGVPDFGVGDPGVAGGIGRVSVHSGLDGGILMLIDPPAPFGAPGAGFGTCLDGLGDTNADGVPDLAVAAPGAGLGQVQATGRAWIFSGADGAILHELAPGTLFPLSSFAQAIARTEDVDGDSVADLRLSAGVYPIGPSTSVAAELRTYSGATGALIERWQDMASSILAAVPDADGDGRSDVLIGQGQQLVLALDGWADPAAVPACPGQVSSTGCVPQLVTQGTPSLTQFDALEVRVSKLPVGTVGLCVYGPNPATLPFGNALLCVAPPFLRTPLQSSAIQVNSCLGQQSSVVSTTLDKADLAALGLSAGDAFHLQGWFRDPGFAPPNDFGLSGSLVVQLWP